MYSVLWLDRIYADEVRDDLLRLALLKSPATIHAASGCMLIYPLGVHRVV